MSIHIVKRENCPLWKRCVFYLVAVLSALGIGAIVLLSIGVNPFEYYFQMFSMGLIDNPIAYKTLMNYFKEFDIILTDVEKESERLWHAMTAALFVEKELGITDSEIISAIRYHTTAKSDMTKLEKIIFVADFTSADRNYKDISVMRKLADKSLEEAMIYALSYTVNKLIENKQLIHPDALSAYNYLLNKR